MVKRIFAALLSILLVLSLLLSHGTTAKAVSWASIMEQYNALFKSGSYKSLYTSLILDPDTFVNQLAFRVAETKSEVMLCLTDPRITPEQLRIMTQVVASLRSIDLDRTDSETQLLDAMYEHFVCADFQYQGIVTDCEELMEWVKTADPAGAYDLSLELARALIGTPEAVLSQMALESEAVQDRVIELLQIHNTTYLATAVVNSISRNGGGSTPETASLALEIYTSLGCKGAPVFSDPDPEEHNKWLTEAPLNPSIYVDYERLFAVLDSKGLANALLDDTRNFVKNLAYQDAETKQDVFDALTGTLFEDWQLLQMYLCLQQHQKSTVLNKSQTALVEALMYHLDYAYCGRGQPRRDISVLFHEAETGDATMPARHDAFCRELKFAFLGDPYRFIVRLATEDEFVQSYVVQCLMSVNSNNAALIRRVYSQWIQEENADYYTEEQLEQIRQVTVSYLPMLGEAPKPSDPDPEEYAQWLKDKGLLVDDPGVVLPIRPTETQPVTLPTETQPTAGEDPEKDTGWVSTVCFTLGFLCIGIAAGSVIAKKKKAKKAAQAEKQAAAEVPVKIYPKLLYCPAPLSRESQKQISHVLREKYDEYSIHWYSIKQPDGTCRCYGTEGGYDILFYAGGLRMEIPASCTVGECAFLFETSFELYAHKDGQLTDLNTALEQGLVSHQAVQEALDKHNSISR